MVEERVVRREGGRHMLRTFSLPAATQTAMPMLTMAATAAFIARDFWPPSEMFTTYTISIASVGD